MSYTCLVNRKKIEDAHEIAFPYQFHDGKYDFEVGFEVTDKDSSYEPGEYCDNVTVTVVEMDA
jgi:hypothetical protein